MVGGDPPTLTDYRGRATFGGTPKGMGTIAELYQRARRAKDGWAAYQCPSTDNIHIPGIAEEVQQAKGDMPLALWEQEYLGKPMGTRATRSARAISKRAWPPVRSRSRRVRC